MELPAALAGAARAPGTAAGAALPSPLRPTGRYQFSGVSRRCPPAGTGLLKGSGAGCFGQCAVLGDKQLGLASASCSFSFSFCIFLHSFSPFLPVFSRSPWSSLRSLSLAFPGAGSLPPIPHSGQAQKRCLELQAAEPGRKIRSDEDRKTSFSSGHIPSLPLPLIRLLVEQAQKNAADFGFIPPSVQMQRRIMERFFLTYTEPRFLSKQGGFTYICKETRSLCSCKEKYCETGEVDTAASQVERRDAIFDRPPNCA